MNKETLIDAINQFFLDNEIGGSVDLTALGRNFETSTGEEEGSIEIISVYQRGFLYTPAGDLEQIDGELEVLNNSDLAEILDALDDYKTNMDKTMKRARE